MPVGDFSDLLRLAINLSKHIMCYHNDTMAEFVVIVEDSAYCYKINYDSADTDIIDSIEEAAKDTATAKSRD